MQTNFSWETPSLSTAIFSADELYRYVLVRDVGAGAGVLNAVGINPSTAGKTVNDQTVLLLMALCRRLHKRTLRLTNMYAWRDRDPKALPKVKDPIGPDNDMHLVKEATAADLVLCMWGQSLPPGGLDRSRAVEKILRATGHPLYCLGVTKNGHPRHPLFLGADTPVVPWPGYPTESSHGSGAGNKMARAKAAVGSVASSQATLAEGWG